MADVNFSDDDEVAQFFNDSDDNEEFEGFGPEDLLIGNDNIFATLPLADFSPNSDRDLPDDIRNGWDREDIDILNVPFPGQSRLYADVPDDGNPIDFLKLFIDDEFINLLVFETNRYAETKAGGELKENSRKKKWKPVTLDEMKVFISLVLAMGLVEKSDLHQYWSKCDVIDTPFFRDYMSRDRFLVILSNSHLSDNENQIPRGQLGFDPLFKVCPFVNLLLEKFGDVYSPDRDLSLDEATCPWKGHLRFKVYHPAKPTRFGIKLFEVCEARSGYCLGFDIYTGCSSICEQADLVMGENTCCTTTKTVIGLLSRSGLLYRGHHIYMDNYYVSPELFIELNMLNSYACGTVRKNRLGLPDVVRKNVPKLKKGEMIFRRNESLLAVKHRDRRDVHMLTTIHQATDSVLDKNDRRTGEPVVKPTCVVDYCSLMGGVDLSDQINQYYSCLRKTSKWYKKLFFYLLNLCVINAFILFKKFRNGATDHHTFWTSIVKALLAEATTAPRPNSDMGRKVLGEKPFRLIDRHFLSYIPPKVGAKRARPMRDCVACNYKQSRRQTFKRSQTSYWCAQCNVALCAPRCFEAYPTSYNYRAVLLPEGGNASDSD